MHPLRITVLFLFLNSNIPISANPQSTLIQPQSDPNAYLPAARSLLAESASDGNLTLISKRVATLFGNAKPPKVEHVPDLTVACKLALLLHRTDPEFALPVLQKHTPDALAAAKISGTAGDRFLSFAAQFCQLRFESGIDPAALDDYVGLLPTADPDAFTQLPTLLRFLLTYPDEPKLAALADSLFNKTDGEWNPIVGLTDRYYAGYTARDLYAAPLLWKHPAFRKQLLRLLANTDPIGELRVTDSESFAISITKGWTDAMTDPGWKGDLPAPGTKIPIRICDFHAIFAARQPDAPAFLPFWSIEKRDAALTKLRTHYAKGDA